jgi:CopG family nickel-responsive transcriptional regulator
VEWRGFVTRDVHAFPLEATVRKPLVDGAVLAAPNRELDNDSCMEVTALRGASSEVQHFADHIIAERGVRYGHVVMIPTDVAKPRWMPANKRAHGHHHD